MLEASQFEKVDNDNEHSWHGSHPMGVGSQTQNRGSSRAIARSGEQITFKKFRSEYWTRFPQSLTKGLGMLFLYLPFVDSHCLRLRRGPGVQRDHGFAILMLVPVAI